MKSAQEKLAEVKAENELLALGWAKGKCPSCVEGFIEAPEALRGFTGGVKCPNCDGTGISWILVQVEEEK